MITKSSKLDVHMECDKTNTLKVGNKRTEDETEKQREIQWTKPKAYRKKKKTNKNRLCILFAPVPFTLSPLPPTAQEFHSYSIIRLATSSSFRWLMKYSYPYATTYENVVHILYIGNLFIHPSCSVLRKGVFSCFKGLHSHHTDSRQIQRVVFSLRNFDALWTCQLEI